MSACLCPCISLDMIRFIIIMLLNINVSSTCPSPTFLRNAVSACSCHVVSVSVFLRVTVLVSNLEVSFNDNKQSANGAADAVPKLGVGSNNLVIDDCISLTE